MITIKRNKYLMYISIVIAIIVLVLLINSVFNGSRETQKLFLILFPISFLICGVFVTKVFIDSSKTLYKDYSKISLIKNNNKFVYSKDWKQNDHGRSINIFFDIMIDENNLYLLKLPRNNLVLRYSLMGSFLSELFNYLQPKDNKILRHNWVDKDLSKKISDEYKKYISMKIPVKELDNKVFRKNNILKFSYQDKKIYLKTSDKNLNDFLNNFTSKNVDNV